MSTHDHSHNHEHATRNPSFFNLFRCKCPRCRTGDMFVNKNPYNLKETMKMNKYCPACGQPLNIEVGFYFGSGYVSYAFAVALSVATFVAYWVLVGFSVYDNSIFIWLGINAVVLLLCQPYLMRVSRTGWLAFFVGYEPDWRNVPPANPERLNESQEGSW